MFPANEQVEVLGQLSALAAPAAEADWAEARERVQMAALVLSGGDSAQLSSALALAALDWRDLLVAAGLADSDWPEVLRRALARDVPQNEA